MIRSQRGVKRICPSCGVRFYDMCRTPIVCPGCGTEFSSDDFLKPRRARASASEAPRPAAKHQPAAPIVVKEKEPLAADPEEEDAAIEDVDADDEDDDALIEDASELGEDDDDMAEVMGNVEETEEIVDR